MEASQTAPAQADAPAPEQAQPESAQTEQAQASPDISQIGEQINALQERFDSQFPSQEQGDEGSLWDALGVQPDAGGEEQQETGQQQETNDDFGLGSDFFGQEQAAPMFNSQQDLDAYVEDKVAGVLQPYAFDQEMKSRAAQLGQLEQKYEDIGDYADQIKQALEPRAQQYGINPQFLVSDPALVEAVYKGLKADEASAAEVDASEASNAGATLETGTGPGSQGQEADPDEKIKEAFKQMAQAPKDAFS